MFMMPLVGVAIIAMSPRPSNDRCASRDPDRTAARSDQPSRPRPLNEMPSARRVLTIYRRVAGRPVILVRNGDRIIKEPVGESDRRRIFRP